MSLQKSLAITVAVFVFILITHALLGCMPDQNQYVRFGSNVYVTDVDSSYLSNNNTTVTPPSSDIDSDDDSTGPGHSDNGKEPCGKNKEKHTNCGKRDHSNH